jgi:hypothetical protein
MAGVFISFIHEDEKVAKSLQALIRMELNTGGVFLSSDLTPGELWLERIREALESSKVLVSLLSVRSIRRPWINFETGAAWIQKRLIIPVCIGKLSEASLPRPYGDMQAVVLSGGADKLLGAIAGEFDQFYTPPSDNPFAERLAQSRGESNPQHRLMFFKALKAVLDEYRKDEARLGAGERE